MNAAMKALQEQIAARQKSILAKTAEIVPMIVAIPEGSVDPEIVGFVSKAHEEVKADLERIRKNGNGAEKR